VADSNTKWEAGIYIKMHKESTSLSLLALQKTLLVDPAELSLSRSRLCYRREDDLLIVASTKTNPWLFYCNVTRT